MHVRHIHVSAELLHFMMNYIINAVIRSKLSRCRLSWTTGQIQPLRACLQVSLRSHRQSEEHSHKHRHLDRGEYTQIQTQRQTNTETCFVLHSELNMFTTRLQTYLSNCCDRFVYVKSFNIRDKKLSYGWETVRRESMPRIAEMDVEMTT